jgi:hypothetical protein
MKWYKKILFWEIHRIPLNIIICSMILFGGYVFSSASLNTGDDGISLMNCSLLILITLIVFNFFYTFTWIIALFLKITDTKYSKIILLLIYLICLLSFFIGKILNQI